MEVKEAMDEAKANHSGGIAPHHFLEPHQLKLSPHSSSSSRQRDTSTSSIDMDDIHAPTVSSGPTSSGYSNGIPKEQLTLQELINEKDRVEAELKALGQVLDSVRMQCCSV
jgi:hypothetical protein